MSVLQRFWSLDRNQVKYIAMITMLLDHAAIFFCVPGSILYWFLRDFGRMSYPLFCVLFVMGFFQIKRERYLLHMQDLFLLAVVSEPFFDYMLSGSFFSMEHMNVMFSWLLGFGLMWLCEQTDFVWMHVLFVLTLGSIAYFCHVDYSYAGILCIYVLYEFYTGFPELRDKPYVLCVIVCLLLGLYSGRFYQFSSVLISFFYDPQKVCKHTKIQKYVMYLFYPVHLCTFSILSMI